MLKKEKMLRIQKKLLEQGEDDIENSKNKRGRGRPKIKNSEKRKFNQFEQIFE